MVYFESIISICLDPYLIKCAGLQLSVKTKDFLVSALISKDSTFRVKEETLDTQLKDLHSRIEVLTVERASDTNRIDQMVKENKELTAKLALSLEANQQAEQKYHVSPKENDDPMHTFTHCPSYSPGSVSVVFRR